MKGEILVIREFERFSEILSEAGFAVINFPLIKTEVLQDLSELEKRIAELENFDGVFLTSPNAAAPFLEKLNGRNFSGKIYVLGERTLKMLEAAGIETVFSETANTASELLNAIPASDLKGKRFLFLRGNLSLRTIHERLAGISEVVETVVYQTRAVKPARALIEEIAGKIEKGEIEAVCFFSPSGAEEFLRIFADFAPNKIRIAVIGTTTAQFIEHRGLKAEFIASKPSAEDFAKELIEYLENEK